MMTKPPKFTSIDLEEHFEPVFECDHEWSGFVDLAGQLKMRCTDCREFAKCSCCGETVRNESNTWFKCGCEWISPHDNFVFDPSHKKCTKHDQGDSIRMAMRPGSFVEVGQLCFLDTVSQKLHTMSEVYQRGLPVGEPVGVVTGIDRTDAMVTIQIYKSRKP